MATMIAMQLKEPTPQENTHNWDHMAARLHARVQSNGVYRAQITGISDVLAQEGKRMSLWVDTRTEPALVHLIHADERDYQEEVGYFSIEGTKEDPENENNICQQGQLKCQST